MRDSARALSRALLSPKRYGASFTRATRISEACFRRLVEKLIPSSTFKERGQQACDQQIGWVLRQRSHPPPPSRPLPPPSPRHPTPSQTPPPSSTPSRSPPLIGCREHSVDVMLWYVQNCVAGGGNDRQPARRN